MSSSFPSCFRPPHTSDETPPPPPSLSTTYLYRTHLGLVSLTWSRSVLGRSLHLQLHYHIPQLHPSSSSSFASFHLHIKPFFFCNKHGVKRISPNTRIFWNISKARFGAAPEPLSGFFVAVVVDKNMVLLVGDAVKDAYSRTRVLEPLTPQILLLKREHVVANKVCSAKAKFGGRMRDIQIDCVYGDDSRLCFSVDAQKVLQIKHLKWKFRGNERVEVDGVPIQISWDVYNWLFEKDNGDRHAIFMFKFEEEEEEEDDDDDDKARGKEIGDRKLTNLWTQQQNWSGSNELGKTLSSSSASTSSSARSLGASSSVLEWSSVEENELVVPVGFSLLIYAWKS
ncbi:uncharacterized protein LOC129302110 [Prosopis cineraria]|uniref:uncharacterized protein LOC129302110 n=1 Tax=Prosopis cineraria TaxID=364024 RepID=UPI00240EF80D|nr:uncharacterized protein LOC129302110 [Prosopis cineraria]